MPLDGEGAGRRARAELPLADATDIEAEFQREWVRGSVALAVDGASQALRRHSRAVAFALFERYDLEDHEPAERPTYAGRWRREFDLPVTQVDEPPLLGAPRAAPAVCSRRCARSPRASRSSAPRRARSSARSRRERARATARSTACAGVAQWPDLSGTRYELAGARWRAAAWASCTCARDRELERDVALKVLDVAAADAGDGERGCAREARMLARLEHPGIVPVHDVGTPAGRPRLLRDEAGARASGSTSCWRPRLPLRERLRLFAARSASRSPSPTRTASSTAT